jgi:hypothetical protein
MCTSRKHACVADCCGALEAVLDLGGVESCQKVGPVCVDRDRELRSAESRLDLHRIEAVPVIEICHDVRKQFTRSAARQVALHANVLGLFADDLAVPPPPCLGLQDALVAVFLQQRTERVAVCMHARGWRGVHACVESA